MGMPYTFGILRIGPGEEIARNNDELLGSMTLGIEVNDERLAARCGLGNIDPQHDPDRVSASALELALQADIPPEGARLVTISPDADSVSAMAVLLLRVLGHGSSIDKMLVTAVGMADTFGFEEANRRDAMLDWNALRTSMSALQQIAKNTDGQWPTLDERVLESARLVGGVMDGEEIDEIAALKEKHFSYRGEYDVEEIIPETVVLIEAPRLFQQARDWGNRRYPVVIVCDPEYRSAGIPDYVPHPRWCIIWRRSRRGIRCDRDALCVAFNEAEAEARTMSVGDLARGSITWGGNEVILGSPRGCASRLSRDDIVAIVLENLIFPEKSGE